jgi:6-phosphogluconolactonase (cycloisomerase 2 family)
MALLVAVGGVAKGDDDAQRSDNAQRGYVYVLTNEASGNQLARFARASDGNLAPAGSFETGGGGTGAGLGNQAALAFGAGKRFLYAVNPGSDEVSVFDLRGSEPRLIQTVASGGQLPISIDVRGNLAYVLNGGGARTGGVDNLTGFWVGHDGRLHAIPGSERALSAANTGPAQVGFSPNGNVVVVTEKATNRITTYLVGRHGLLSAGAPQESEGDTPFGFEFDNRGTLVVSEAFGGAANASAVSSYVAPRFGPLMTRSASVPTTESAACWIAITRNGRYAYTTNTASGTVSGYEIMPDRTLRLLTEDGRTGVTGMGSSPIDEDTVGNRFLYVLNRGTGSVEGFRIGEDGSLAPLNEVAGLPTGMATGLVAE